MNDAHTIIIADDHEVMLDGLKAILEREPDLHIIGSASNGEELLTKVNALKPELCIVDLDMPVMNGLKASELLFKHHEGIKIILLTMHKEPSILKKVRALGIQGYVLKTGDGQELIFAVKQVLKGKAYYSEELFGKRNTLSDEDSELDKAAQLTKRERQIVKLICQGHSNNTIAEILFISSNTVDNHRANIMRKLNVRNIVELTRFCLRNSLA